MNINLGAQWEGYIQRHLETGPYVSASEVVREGLRLLQEREELRELHLERLRHDVDKGLDALERRDTQDFDKAGLKEHLEGVKSRGRARRAKKKASNT